MHAVGNAPRAMKRALAKRRVDLFGSFARRPREQRFKTADGVDVLDPLFLGRVLFLHEQRDRRERQHARHGQHNRADNDGNNQPGALALRRLQCVVPLVRRHAGRQRCVARESRRLVRACAHGVHGAACAPVHHGGAVRARNGGLKIVVRHQDHGAALRARKFTLGHVVSRCIPGGAIRAPSCHNAT